MGVRKRDVDIQWFSSLLLVMLGGLVYRGKRWKDRYLQMSLHEFAQKHLYVPSWMDSLMQARRAHQPKSLSPRPPATPEQGAEAYFAWRRYRMVRFLHDKILFR